jgi:hypothetical protein
MWWIIPMTLAAIGTVATYLLLGGLSDFPILLKIAWASAAGGAIILTFHACGMDDGTRKATLDDDPDNPLVYGRMGEQYTLNDRATIEGWANSRHDPDAAMWLRNHPGAGWFLCLDYKIVRAFVRRRDARVWVRDTHPPIIRS